MKTDPVPHWREAKPLLDDDYVLPSPEWDNIVRKREAAEAAERNKPAPEERTTPIQGVMGHPDGAVINRTRIG